MKDKFFGMADHWFSQDVILATETLGIAVACKGILHLLSETG